MTAMEKMKHEGTLKKFIKEIPQACGCPKAYGLKDKCEGDHAKCWENALTTDYEGVDD